MAVIVKYVVVRDGKEEMMFATKKEADAYDKMLDIAERLSAYLRRAELDLTEDQLDAVTFFLATHRDQVGRLLKGGALDAVKEPAKASAETPEPVQSPESTESRAPEATKRSRTRKSSAAA
jgi:dsDNA-binding SOS-regulon protein